MEITIRGEWLHAGQPDAPPGADQSTKSWRPALENGLRRMPTWLQAVIGLAAPLIAAAGVFAGYQQWLLGRRGLKHDLFDRRWAVYAATNDVIAAHLAGNASEASAYLDTFRRRRKDAEFLLPEETNAFLTEVFDAVNTYRDARSVIAKNRNDDPHKDAAENSVRKAEVVLMDLHGRLVEQFRSPLDLSR